MDNTQISNTITMNLNTIQNESILVVHKNRDNSSNFNVITLKFSEKFHRKFSLVYILGNMFTESHTFVAILVINCIKDTCSNLSLSN